jgi:hypothetical protein
LAKINELVFRNENNSVEYCDDFGGSVHIYGGSYEGASITIDNLDWLIESLQKIKEICE